MLKISQTIIVEGKYDKAKLSSLVDATILTTDGFDVFRDKEMLRLFRTLAEETGLIILTDSDAAGFRIRNYIAGAVDASQITHVYIPDLFGKERRKDKPSAEGKLGVEGIPAEILLEALTRAGVAVEESPRAVSARPVTQGDLVEWGFSGGDNSFQMRQLLLKKLRLPGRMNVKSMLGVINILYDYDTFVSIIESL